MKAVQGWNTWTALLLGANVASTIAELTARKAAYVAAEAAILGHAQSYTIADRAYTKADLKEIRAAIKDIDEQIDAQSCPGMFNRTGFGCYR